MPHFASFISRSFSLYFCCLHRVCCHRIKHCKMLMKHMKSFDSLILMRCLFNFSLYLSRSPSDFVEQKTDRHREIYTFITSKLSNKLINFRARSNEFFYSFFFCCPVRLEEREDPCSKWRILFKHFRLVRAVVYIQRLKYGSSITKSLICFNKIFFFFLKPQLFSSLFVFPLSSALFLGFVGNFPFVSLNLTMYMSVINFAVRFHRLIRKFTCEKWICIPKKMVLTLSKMFLFSCLVHAY